MSRCKPAFVMLAWCHVGTSIPQQLPCSWYSASVLGPRWWKKLLFHCPCKAFCALVVLDQRHLIDVQIYPAGCQSSLTGWWPRSLRCSVPGLLQRGAGRRQKSDSGNCQGFFWLLTSLWDPLRLQKALCSLAHRWSVSWWRDAALKTETEDACVLSDRWMSHPGLSPLSATLQSNEAQPGEDGNAGLQSHRVLGMSGLG